MDIFDLLGLVNLKYLSISSFEDMAPPNKRIEQDVEHEIHEMIHAWNLTFTEKDINLTKEALAQHLIDPANLYTMPTSLFHYIKANLKKIVPNRCEYEVINERWIVRKVICIAIDYKAWHTHVTQELQVQLQALVILGLGPS